VWSAPNLFEKHSKHWSTSRLDATGSRSKEADYHNCYRSWSYGNQIPVVDQLVLIGVATRDSMSRLLQWWERLIGTAIVWSQGEASTWNWKALLVRGQASIRVLVTKWGPEGGSPRVVILWQARGSRLDPASSFGAGFLYKSSSFRVPKLYQCAHACTAHIPTPNKHITSHANHVNIVWTRWEWMITIKKYVT
jgi:hypothetical protein